MSFVPEDRLGMGLVASMGMTDNMLLKGYQREKALYQKTACKGIGGKPYP